MSALLWCVDMQKGMPAMRQSQAAAEALAHQRLQAVNACGTHCSQQVDIITFYLLLLKFIGIFVILLLL